MTGSEVAVLGWVSDFVKTLMNTLLGERLKRKSSSERARDAALHLYRTLAEVGETSRNFVTALSAMADGERDASDSLEYALGRVASALSGLVWACKQVDPQLPIHAPSVAEEIDLARRSRAYVVSEAEQALREFLETESLVELQVVTRHARTALAEIEAATESLRRFVAEQFSFKESF